MRKAGLLVAVVALALSVLAWPPALRADEDDPEPSGRGRGLRQLRGKWVVAEVLFGGKVAKFPLMTYEFDGDKMTTRNGGHVTVSKVKLLPATKKGTIVLDAAPDDPKVEAGKVGLKLD